MHVFIDDTVSLGMNNLIPNTCKRTDSIAWKLEQLRKIEVNILVSRKKIQSFAGENQLKYERMKLITKSWVMFIDN